MPEYENLIEQAEIIRKGKAKHIAKAVADECKKHGVGPFQLYAWTLRFGPMGRGISMHQAHPAEPWRALCHDWLQLDVETLTSKEPDADTPVCGLCQHLHRQASDVNATSL